MSVVLSPTAAPQARPAPRFMRRQREREYYDVEFQSADWWLGKTLTLPRNQMPPAPRMLSAEEIRPLGQADRGRLCRLIFGYPCAVVASEVIWTMESLAKSPRFVGRLQSLRLAHRRDLYVLARVVRSALRAEGEARRQKRGKRVRVFDFYGTYIPSLTYLDRAEWYIAMGDARWRKKGGLQILSETPWDIARAKRLVMARDQSQCVWCGRSGHTFEHLVPRSRGGRSVVANGACACEEHNQARGTMGLRRWVRVIGIDWTAHAQLRRLLNPPRHLRLAHPVPLPRLPKV